MRVFIILFLMKQRYLCSFPKRNKFYWTVKNRNWIVEKLQNRNAEIYQTLFLRVFLVIIMVNFIRTFFSNWCPFSFIQRKSVSKQFRIQGSVISCRETIYFLLVKKGKLLPSFLMASSSNIPVNSHFIGSSNFETIVINGNHFHISLGKIFLKLPKK